MSITVMSNIIDYCLRRWSNARWNILTRTRYITDTPWRKRKPLAKIQNISTTKKYLIDLIRISPLNVISFVIFKKVTNYVWCVLRNRLCFVNDSYSFAEHHEVDRRESYWNAGPIGGDNCGISILFSNNSTQRTSFHITLAYVHAPFVIVYRTHGLSTRTFKSRFKVIFIQ